MSNPLPQVYVWRLFPLGNVAFLSTTLDNGQVIEVEIGDAVSASLRVMQATREMHEGDPRVPQGARGWRERDAFVQAVGDLHGYHLGLSAIRKYLTKLRTTIEKLTKAFDKDLQPPPLFECGRNRKGYRLAENVVLEVLGPATLSMISTTCDNA